MDALAVYDSSGEEDNAEAPQKEEEALTLDPKESADIIFRLKEKFPLNSAPTVPIRVRVSWSYGVHYLEQLLLDSVFSNFLQEPETNLLRINPSAKEVTYNPTYDQLFAPEV